ncbi:MAG: hypothetical protein IJW59_02095 [Clostridia bacterium]|nr:hypothetical protein [Clostridia bacterium]
MSKNLYYSDVKILKKPLKQRIKTCLNFLLILIVGVGCFLSASYLSSALTVGNLGAFIVYGDTKVKFKETSLYAVVLGEYSSKTEAEKVAITSAIQGASGYIWEDTSYWVVGNIYNTIEDANKVIDNLKESNYKAVVKQIVFPSVVIDFDMYESSDMGVINKSFSIFDELRQLLYDYSIKFDKGEINHLAISSYLSSSRGEVKSIIIDVQNLINKAKSELNSVQEYLVKTDELLDELIIKTIDNSATGYSLKYAIASIARFKYELFVELS